MAESILDKDAQVMCNHCRSYRTDLPSEDSGTITVCQECAKLDCSHHPKNKDLVQAEISHHQILAHHGITRVLLNNGPEFGGIISVDI